MPLIIISRTYKRQPSLAAPTTPFEGSSLAMCYKYQIDWTWQFLQLIRFVYHLELHAPCQQVWIFCPSISSLSSAERVQYCGTQVAYTLSLFWGCQDTDWGAGGCLNSGGISWSGHPVLQICITSFHICLELATTA